MLSPRVVWTSTGTNTLSISWLGWLSQCILLASVRYDERRKNETTLVWPLLLLQDMVHQLTAPQTRALTISSNTLISYHICDVLSSDNRRAKARENTYVSYKYIRRRRWRRIELTNQCKLRRGKLKGYSTRASFFVRCAIDTTLPLQALFELSERNELMDSC